MKTWRNLNCLIAINCLLPSILSLTFMDCSLQIYRQLWFCLNNLSTKIYIVLLWVLVLHCAIRLLDFLVELQQLKLEMLKANLVILMKSRSIIGYLCTQTLICQKHLRFVKLSAIFIKRISKQNTFWLIIFQLEFYRYVCSNLVLIKKLHQDHRELKKI